MKKGVFILSMAFVTCIGLWPCNLSGSNGSPSRQVKKSDVTQVYYFHMTRRCMTCQTVEKVAEQSVNELYPAAVREGRLTFKALNFEEKENKALIRKLKVPGQSLLIVHGEDRFDITDKGFLYAVNEPEKLRAEIKSILEKYLK